MVVKIDMPDSRCLGTSLGGSATPNERLLALAVALGRQAARQFWAQQQALPRLVVDESQRRRDSGGSE